MKLAICSALAVCMALAASGCGDRAARDESAGASNAVVANAIPPTAGDAPARDASAGAPSARSERAKPLPRDPFVPASARSARVASTPRAEFSAKPAAAAPSRRESSQGPLLGVMNRGGVRYALFGERFVARGEDVGGWTIKKIGDNQCVLERGGKTKTLVPGEAP